MHCTERFDWTYAWQEGLFGIGLAVVVLLMILAVVAFIAWLASRS